MELKLFNTLAQALEKANRSGVFTLEESYQIFVALTTIRNSVVSQVQPDPIMSTMGNSDPDDQMPHPPSNPIHPKP